MSVWLLYGFVSAPEFHQKWPVRVYEDRDDAMRALSFLHATANMINQRWAEHFRPYHDEEVDDLPEGDPGGVPDLTRALREMDDKFPANLTWTGCGLAYDVEEVGFIAAEVEPAPIEPTGKRDVQL